MSHFDGRNAPPNAPPSFAGAQSQREITPRGDHQWQTVRTGRSTETAKVTPAFCALEPAVANALDRPQSFVTKCELGERRIDPIELQVFAGLYGKRLSYFLPAVERR